MSDLLFPVSLQLAGLALLLGFKHSYDADHVVAVSNLLRKSKSVKEAAFMSMSWSIGHMLTAAIITILLFIFRETLLQEILSHLELLAGVMLVLIGLWSLRELFSFHAHRHSHPQGGAAVEQHEHVHLHTKSEKTKQFHSHMMGIGIVHGLTSNDELLLLITAELGIISLAGMLLGVAIFSLGVVLGMIVFSAIFTYPLIRAHSDRVYKAMTLITGAASVGYGAMMLTGIA